MVITMAPANSSRMVRCICEAALAPPRNERNEMNDTHLIVEVGIDLRCRLV